MRSVPILRYKKYRLFVLIKTAKQSNHHVTVALLSNSRCYSQQLQSFWKLQSRKMQTRETASNDKKIPIIFVFFSKMGDFFLTSTFKLLDAADIENV